MCLRVTLELDFTRFNPAYGSLFGWLVANRSLNPTRELSKAGKSSIALPIRSLDRSAHPTRNGGQ